jgi:transposase InsO family protein
MKEKVSKYIARCISCRKNKHKTHKLYGEPQFIPIRDVPWNEITIDFVVKLPTSIDPVTGVKYNDILVIVDRLTKYAIIIPIQKDITAEKFAYILLDRLFRNHGIPQSIISDRDKLFTSKYYATLLAQLGIKRKLLSAYHPQTDGQTERTNQSLETYLRHYINKAQDNWVSLLPIA